MSWIIFVLVELSFIPELVSILYTYAQFFAYVIQYTVKYICIFFLMTENVAWDDDTARHNAT